MIEKIFAAVMLAVCMLLLARMLLGETRRDRLDAMLRHAGALWHRRIRGAAAWPAAHARARREAEEAIRRASRSTSDRDGNVIRPKAFKGKRRDLH